MVITSRRVWSNCQSCSWSADQEKCVFLVLVCAFQIGHAEQLRRSRLTQACSFSTPRVNLVLTHKILPPFHDGVHFYTINHHLSGHHVSAYRWRSLPRVSQHRANSPQGSYRNRCCLFRYHHGPIFVSIQICFGIFLDVKPLTCYDCRRGNRLISGWGFIQIPKINGQTFRLTSVERYGCSESLDAVCFLLLYTTRLISRTIVFRLKNQ